MLQRLSQDALPSRSPEYDALPEEAGRARDPSFGLGILVESWWQLVCCLKAAAELGQYFFQVLVMFTFIDFGKRASVVQMIHQVTWFADPRPKTWCSDSQRTGVVKACYCPGANHTLRLTTSWLRFAGSVCGCGYPSWAGNQKESRDFGGRSKPF